MQFKSNPRSRVMQEVRSRPAGSDDNVQSKHLRANMLKPIRSGLRSPMAFTPDDLPQFPENSLFWITFYNNNGGPSSSLPASAPTILFSHWHVLRLRRRQIIFEYKIRMKVLVARKNFKRAFDFWMINHRNRSKALWDLRSDMIRTFVDFFEIVYSWASFGMQPWH